MRVRRHPTREHSVSRGRESPPERSEKHLSGSDHVSASCYHAPEWECGMPLIIDYFRPCHGGRERIIDRDY